MKPFFAQFIAVSIAVFLTGFSRDALAHEGHRNTVEHAFLHLLQQPDHWLMLAGFGAVVIGVWRLLKGARK